MLPKSKTIIVSCGICTADKSRAAEGEHAAPRGLLKATSDYNIFTVLLTTLSFQRPNETRRKQREAYTKQKLVGAINQQSGQNS